MNRSKWCAIIIIVCPIHLHKTFVEISCLNFKRKKKQPLYSNIHLLHTITLFNFDVRSIFEYILTIIKIMILLLFQHQYSSLDRLHLKSVVSFKVFLKKSARLRTIFEILLSL